MDEDKMSSDVTEKRKVEEDIGGSKPNPKRIKLVRPVFSPVAKPSSSTTETKKSYVQPPEISKSNLSDKVLNLVDVSQPVEKPNDKTESIKKVLDLPETVKKSVEKPIDKSEQIKTIITPETVKRCEEKSIDKLDSIKKLIDIPEKVQKTVEKSIDKSESSKKLLDLPETVKKPVVTPPLIPEEQIDISSDSLEIPNIFSEETKKELEHLKKNIFKTEDDGSSSENDSQPKRPRLKRPTFVTSVVENKTDAIDIKIADKITEVTKLELIKPICEENLKKADIVVEKQPITEEKIINVTETIKDNVKGSDVEQNNIVSGNMTEKSIISDNTKELLKKKSIVNDNISVLAEKSIKNDGKIVLDHTLLKDENSVIAKHFKDKEKSTTSNIDDEPVDIKVSDPLNISEEKIIVLGNSDTDTKKAIEIKLDDTQIKPSVFKTDKSVQENYVKKEKVHKLIEIESIDSDKINQIVEASKTEMKKSVEENVKIQKDINEIVSEKDVSTRILTGNVSVVLERFDEIPVDKAQNEKLKPNIKFVVNQTIVESKNVKFNEKCSVDSNTKNEVKTETDIECTVTGVERNSQNKTVETFKDDEFSDLEIKKQISNENLQVENENKDMYDKLSKQGPIIDMKHKQEEHETKLFKSDILKAALMSKKSPESSLVSSTEAHDQPGSQIYSTPLETKKTEILPTIGQEAIINKIEAEIKITPFDHKINTKKSQNKILNSAPDSNISEEACSSVSLNENINVKHDDPPKWGSAKMNEVEKFLNDSNVTITPISKSQESPKLGKITLKLPKVGNPEIKSETTVRPDVKSELIKKITNKQSAMGDSPLKSALSQTSKSFNDLATIRPAPKLSAEQIVLLEQQILNTPKKRGRPPKALAQQKQLLLQYQQQQQQKVQEGSTEDEAVFHVPLFDMEDMSGGASMFESFDASTPKRGKSIRGKGSRGRRGRGGRGRGGREGGSDSDNTSNNRRMDDEKESFQEEMNQDEETKQVAMMEAERLRKEEERERKLEARKKKLKERNDALKEKKLKKKQKAEERRLQWHEKKRLMQEEKLKAAEMKKSLPPPQNFDDETRMSADCNNSRSQTPARNFIMGEDDLSISGTTNDSLRMKKGRMEVIDLESNKTLTVDQIAEYQWPLEGGELYMIQEQISNFLGVKSFKRKYPGLKRRNVEAEERTFLCDSGLVAESLCDLGLTVLYSSEVLDVMYADFPEKYEELREYMRLKHAKELSNRQRALMTVSSNTDGSKLDLRDRAMEAAANWNANLNKSRLESRKCSMDMQTFIVHYPKNKCKKMTVPRPKIGSYPLALLPGQFCDYYATYSSEDLRYFPLNTVMYGPLKSVDKDFPVSLSSQSESDDSSSDDSSDSDDSMDNDNKLEKNDSEHDSSDKKGPDCKICVGSDEKKKSGTLEPLINCSKCSTIYHPTCLDMSLEMIPYIKRYNWQCNECKYCAQCEEVADEDKMLFCDLCDRGYHIYCVGLRKVPEGRWHCQECAMCSSCSVSDPGPGDSKWFYEFKKTEKNGSKVYCRTLCAPCSRLWKKGHYCPNCMRCYSIKDIERMIQCNNCDRYLHPECVNENVSNGQVVACTSCEERAVSRLLTTVPRSLIKV